MDAYSAEHPNVTFKSNLVATKALIPQQEATCEAKDGPTIQYFWGGIYTLGPGWKGCLAPIEDYVGSDEVEHYVARQEVTDEGKVLAAGWYAVPVFPVFYNKDVFAKAGVDPEEAFSSFDAMLEACQTFADKGTPMIGIGAKDESGIGYVWDNLASDTLSVQDMTTAVTGETSFADEKFVSIYEQQLEMRDAGCFPDDLLSTELYPGQQRVLNGKAAATVVTGSGVASFLKELGEDKSGVAILPSRGDGPYAGKMGATAQTLGITSFASDDQKKVAGDFIKFLHTEEQLNSFYDATGVPPADDRFDIEKVTSPVMKQVYQWMYEDGRPTISNFLPNPPVNQNAEMIKVLSGQTDTPQAAAEGLEQVAEQWRKANKLLLERYEGLAAQAKEDGS
jgi:ABC-type glycerol-3-phosphate transport system substrate-binding protein